MVFTGNIAIGIKEVADKMHARHRFIDHLYTFMQSHQIF